MKKTLDKYAWLRLVLGIALLSLGIVLVILSFTCNPEDITKVFTVIFGIYCILGGLIGLAFGLTLECKAKTLVNIVAPAVAIGAGIAFLVISQENIVSRIIETFTPYILITIAAAYIIQGIVEIASKIEVKTWLSRLIIGAILLLGGILILAFGQGAAAQKTLYVLLGIFVAILGIALTVYGIIVLRQNKKLAKAENVEKK